MDRAALDAAMELGFKAGGWCPRGRLAEDGRIDDKYPLKESKTTLYAERTEKNVQDSDATLILCEGPLTGGTELTANLAIRYQKPLLVVNLKGERNVDKIIKWLEENGVQRLNVAGPRESTAFGIHAKSKAFLSELFSRLRKEQ